MTIEKIKQALEFYANSDNYWSAPLSLEKRYCQRTLHDVREAQKENEVLQERGALAKEALKGFVKDIELSEKGIGIWIYLGKGQFDKAPSCYPQDIGTSDFMEKHYLREADYGKYGGESLINHYQLLSDFSGKLPQHVLDLKLGEGDVLCFNNAWQVAEYLSLIMPLINFEQY